MKPERSATVISLLGVILTTASVIASIAQYRAADLQAKAAIVALMPQFEVRALIEKINSDKFTDRRIEISTDGGPVFNLQIDRLTWIKFKRINGEDDIVYNQPLTGFYFVTYQTGRTRGLVATIVGHRNNEKYFKFLGLAQPALGDGVEISAPTTLLRISYRDALKQENVLYVKESSGSETHLSEDAGKQAWERHSGYENTHMPVDISKLTSASEAAKLVNAVKTRLGEGSQ